MNTNTNTWMKVLSDTNMRLIIHTNTNTNTDTDACLKILTDTYTVNFYQLCYTNKDNLISSYHSDDVNQYPSVSHKSGAICTLTLWT